MHTKLKQFLIEIRKLQNSLRNEQVRRISKGELKITAESLARKWFSDIKPEVTTTGIIAPEILSTYDMAFENLLKLAGFNNLRSSYLRTLGDITKLFRANLLTPFIKQPQASTSLMLLNQILSGIPDPNENEYIHEAIRCAQRGCPRGAVILGWCAAINRIHNKIERLGFARFTVTSSEIAAQKTGRFKRFNSPQNVGSIGELREVFDNVLLWVIEGMGLIDPNQHTRLKSCFDMRCQCAHPGEAPITEWNLLSFFSDINEIVLKNDTFKICK
jgi:hypothetical protein